MKIIVPPPEAGPGNILLHPTTGNGIQVLDDNGKPMDDIAGIDIRIRPGEVTRATVVHVSPQCEICAATDEPDTRIEEDLADRMVAFLNQLNEIDPVALANLITHRVACNEALAIHPTVQVGRGGGGTFTVGMLGILNGLVGAREDGWGVISAEVEEDGSISRFRRLPTQSTPKVGT